MGGRSELSASVVIDASTPLWCASDLEVPSKRAVHILPHLLVLCVFLRAQSGANVVLTRLSAVIQISATRQQRKTGEARIGTAHRLHKKGRNVARLPKWELGAT